MNLSNRITKLEKLAAGMPEINREHVAALVRFLETGDDSALPPEGIARNETIMTARTIPAEDADAYPGFARIAEAMRSPRLCLEVCANTPAGALAALQRLDPAALPSPLIYHAVNGTPPTRGHRLLARLGIVRILRVIFGDKSEQKGTDS